MQHRIALTEKEKEQKKQQLDQEERLAKELEKLKWEKEKDERYRQQIRENRYCYGILEINVTIPLFPFAHSRTYTCTYTVYNFYDEARKI